MRRITPPSLLAFALALLPFPLHAADKDGFTPLFNGKDLTGWKTHFGKTKADTTNTVTVNKDGIIVVTGQPNGFFYTQKSYKNYVLRYDWRYKRPKALVEDARFLGNSGLLVHIQDPNKGFTPRTIWPQCVEVQGMNRDHGKLLFLPPSSGSGKWDKTAKDRATHKVGELNTTEVRCGADGSLVVKINGTQVATGKGKLTEGLIGFQSEGAEIHFRNIRMKPIE